MRKTLLVASAALLLSNTAFAQSEYGPFSDVPTGHWAYQSISHLAQNGVLRGYPDGSFKGNKPVTRYAMAVVVSQMLANLEKMNSNAITKQDLADIEKLTIEFADELNVLGVKIKALEDDMVAVKEDVATVKTDVQGLKDYIKSDEINKVKLSGDMLVRHYDYGMDKAPRDQTGKPLYQSAFGNHRSDTRLRLQLDTRVDERVSVRARWNLTGGDGGNMYPWGGAQWDGDNKATGEVEVAYVKIDNVFNGIGTLKLGRDWFSHGHGLVVHNFMDAISYTRPCGEVNLALNVFYDRNNGAGNNDYHNIWNINLDTDINNRHHLYAGVYYNSFDNDSNVVKNGSANDPMNKLNVYYTRDGSGRFVENKATRADRADVKDIKRTVVEFGAKGELSKDGKFAYDAAGVYSKVQYSSLDPNTYQDPDPAKVRYNSHDEDGWMAHAAVKYDNKKDWTAKVSYTYADDKSAASINRRDDNVWCGEEETPFQDILWYQCEGTNTYLNMQRIYNMQDVKLQVGYTPVNASKHHFRLAFDWVLEADDRYNTYKDARNTMNYDKLDFKMLTFEYTYDLSENTKLRMGYAKTFEDSVIKRGLRTSAGIVNASPLKAKDQHIFYSELYSKF